MSWDQVIPPLVRLERVSKRYEVARRPGPAGATAETALQAVTDFTLDVGAGEFVSIIGPSGCGKSTVLFLLAGLRPPSSGRVEVCGQAPAEATRSGLASVIFQQPVLFEWLTVEDNVLLPLRMRDPRWWAWPLRRREYATRARDALATVELDGFAHYRPEALSGGMQQRTRDRMNLELLRLWEERGLSIVFVTHSIEEAVFLSDRVVVMGRGRSVKTGGSIVRIVDVNLPRPRRLAVKEEVTFFQKVREGREALREA
jgi:NitT/TauT family transport system ATP-binding protein